MKTWQWYVLDLAVWIAIAVTCFSINDKDWAVTAAMVLVTISRDILNSLKPK